MKIPFSEEENAWNETSHIRWSDIAVTKFFDVVHVVIKKWSLPCCTPGVSMTLTWPHMLNSICQQKYGKHWKAITLIAAMFVIAVLFSLCWQTNIWGTVAHNPTFWRALVKLDRNTQCIIINKSLRHIPAEMSPANCCFIFGHSIKKWLFWASIFIASWTVKYSHLCKWW